MFTKKGRRTVIYIAGLLVLTACLFVVPTTTKAASSSSVSFADVNSSTSHASDITWLANQGISTGFEELSFKPYSTVKRCDMASFLRRTAIEAGVEDAASWTPSDEDWARFSDVSSSTYHAEDILWLASAGITTGYVDEGTGDATFKPDGDVTRADMAAFLRRLAELIGVEGADSYEPDDEAWETFSDVTDSTYHAEDILWLAHAGISTGFADGTYMPNSSVKRCDMATFLRNLAKLSGASDAETWTPSSSDWSTFTDVTTSTDHAEDILWLAHAEITTGYSTYYFRPMSSVTRCDMAAFIRRLAVLMGVSDAETWTPSSSDWSRFTDVTSSTDHAEDILWLAHAGISVGWEEQNGTYTFRPYNSIARADMAQFLYKLAQLAGDEGALNWSYSSASAVVSFTDVSSSGSYHPEAVLWLSYAGISQGYSGGTFKPYSDVARCDMAAFLHRLYGCLQNGGSNSTGWVAQGTSWCYVDPLTGSKLTGWQSLGGRQYYFDSSGKVADEGWLTQNGTKYYITSGRYAATGFQTIDGKKYYFDSSGVMQTGWVTISGSKYYFNSSGVMQTGVVSINGTNYYIASNGVYSATNYHNIEWAGQPNNYYCGPASGYMVLRNVGAWYSASGTYLTVYNVASYMGTTTAGTNFQTRQFMNGMNGWLGKSVYTSVHTPSYSTVRNAILNSYVNGYATVVDTIERRGGAHLNGHNNATFYHIMVVDGYNQETDQVQLVDPGAGTVWSGSSQKFWYSLSSLVTNFMQTEIDYSREHIGVHYAKY